MNQNASDRSGRLGTGWALALKDSVWASPHGKKKQKLHGKQSKLCIKSSLMKYNSPQLSFEFLQFFLLHSPKVTQTRPSPPEDDPAGRSPARRCSCFLKRKQTAAFVFCGLTTHHTRRQNNGIDIKGKSKQIVDVIEQ